MAHKKGQGSTKNGRDSNAQRRGVKKFGGESVRAGNIIVRQVGTKFHPGNNVGLGKDFTIFSLIDGHVKFEYGARGRKFVSVYGADVDVVEVAEAKPVAPAPAPAPTPAPAPVAEASTQALTPEPAAPAPAAEPAPADGGATQIITPGEVAESSTQAMSPVDAE